MDYYTNETDNILIDHSQLSKLRKLKLYYITCTQIQQPDILPLMVPSNEPLPDITGHKWVKTSRNILRPAKPVNALEVLDEKNPYTLLELDNLLTELELTLLDLYQKPAMETDILW
jgi:hypothetical protein